MEKARLKAPYIFSVITFGNFAANVADCWDDFCRQKGVTCQFACVHACPQKALTLHRERNPQARYRNKNVSLGDIKRANNQQ